MIHEKIATAAEVASNSKVAALPGVAASAAGLMGQLQGWIAVVTLIFLGLQIGLLLWTWRRKKKFYDAQDKQLNLLMDIPDDKS